MGISKSFEQHVCRLKCAFYDFVALTTTAAAIRHISMYTQTYMSSLTLPPHTHHRSKKY